MHTIVNVFYANAECMYKKLMNSRGSRTSKGRNTINFLEMQKDEKVSAIMAIDDYESEASLFYAKKGVVKRLKLAHTKIIEKVVL